MFAAGFGWVRFSTGFYKMFGQHHRLKTQLSLREPDLGIYTFALTASGGNRYVDEQSQISKMHIDEGC